MLYVILAHDTANNLAKRKEVRPAHLARIQKLKDEGRLILAGPRPAIDATDPGAAGFSGSLIVAEFENLQSARTWAEADPFMAAGVYSHVDVYPFVKTLP